MENKKPVKYNPQFLKKVLKFTYATKKEAVIFFQNEEEVKQEEIMFLFMLEMAIDKINNEILKIKLSRG